ncbi:MAG: ribbon-helix-helix protein, CopG family [Caenibius sp.]
MHSEIINFRASPDLAAALSQAAQAEGVTVSELVRRAVQAKVGPSTSDDPALDPFAALHAAATGSLEAQRAIADRAVALVNEDNDRDSTTTLIEGLVFARLAAAHGDVSDQRRVIAMLAALAEHADEDSTAELVGEAVARIELAASAGADDADAVFFDLASNVSPDVMICARNFHARIGDRIGGA